MSHKSRVFNKAGIPSYELLNINDSHLKFPVSFPTMYNNCLQRITQRNITLHRISSILAIAYEITDFETE